MTAASVKDKIFRDNLLMFVLPKYILLDFMFIPPPRIDSYRRHLLGDLVHKLDCRQGLLQG